MANEPLRTLVTQGLGALRAGCEVAAQATSEIQGDASHPDLKAALRSGEQVSQQWSQRIEQAIAEAGGDAQTDDNPILSAHFEVSRRIRQEARDDMSRDLGIIAAGQLAPHYWIAAFGTLRTHAAQLGMRQTEQDLQRSLDEAKRADQQHSGLAGRILTSA